MLMFRDFSDISITTLIQIGIVSKYHRFTNKLSVFFIPLPLTWKYNLFFHLGYLEDERHLNSQLSSFYFYFLYLGIMPLLKVAHF